MEDDDGHPKMKMYADEYGNFNGEALIVYFMEDSVRLAGSILDDAEMRLGDPTRMRVRQANLDTIKVKVRVGRSRDAFWIRGRLRSGL